MKPCFPRYYRITSNQKGIKIFRIEPTYLFRRSEGTTSVKIFEKKIQDCREGV